MSKHHSTIRYKGKCECGFKTHSLQKLNDHTRSRGHKAICAPSKSSFNPGK